MNECFPFRNFGDKPIRPSNNVKMEQKENTYTFTIEKTVPKDSGLYSVRAQNEVGSQFAQARLKVIGKCNRHHPGRNYE